MTPDVLAAWSTFFATEATVAATLVGLLFVAVSLNIERILAFDHLPARAADVLGTFVVVLLMALGALVPGRTNVEFGIVLLVLATPLAMISFKAQRASLRAFAGRSALVYGRVLMVILSIGLYFTAALLLLENRDGALLALAAGMNVALVVSISNCWVLLVEIKR
jgi:modulator of FtsH protease